MTIRLVPIPLDKSRTLITSQELGGAVVSPEVVVPGDCVAPEDEGAAVVVVTEGAVVVGVEPPPVG